MNAFTMTVKTIVNVLRRWRRLVAFYFLCILFYMFWAFFRLQGHFSDAERLVIFGSLDIGMFFYILYGGIYRHKPLNLRNILCWSGRGFHWPVTGWIPKIMPSLGIVAFVALIIWGWENYEDGITYLFFWPVLFGAVILSFLLIIFFIYFIFRFASFAVASTMAGEEVSIVEIRGIECRSAFALALSSFVVFLLLLIPTGCIIRGSIHIGVDPNAWMTVLPRIFLSIFVIAFGTALAEVYNLASSRLIPTQIKVPPSIEEWEES
jgi:hypothetical protein